MLVVVPSPLLPYDGWNARSCVAVAAIMLEAVLLCHRTLSLVHLVYFGRHLRQYIRLSTKWEFVGLKVIINEDKCNELSTNLAILVPEAKTVLHCVINACDCKRISNDKCSTKTSTTADKNCGT